MERGDSGPVAEAALSAIPRDPPDIIAFGEENFASPTSARSKWFRIAITPWLRKPLLAGVDGTTRIGTFVKPVQTGGSAMGELLILYWCMFWQGMVQYNWSNDKRAKERWDSRVESIFRSCPPIAQKMAIRDAMGDVMKCEVDFGNAYFRMQGAFVPENLDSDSVSLQLNEEVHAWEPGHLSKARGRTTAVWNYKSFDISNAGKAGSQYHEAFLAGTQERWEVLCPSCGKRHFMRTRWEDHKPELGGLRYDSDRAKMKNGEYNWQVVHESLRFQMPCGFVVANDMLERQRLSEGADYGPPREGHDPAHRSWTFDAVAVDYIDWMSIVKRKHAALRARRRGDPEDWRRYVTEVECLFYDPNDAPITEVATIVPNLRKSREGLPNLNKVRLFALDRQQGYVADNEFPHWWLVIRDFAVEDDRLVSQLVYEGKRETDEDVIATLNEHNCKMWQGVADSGDDTIHVYTFCMRHGINAIKGGGEDFYNHTIAPGVQARRVYSVERPLHGMLNREPKYSYVPMGGRMVPDPREPLFWLYSKHGIRERLFWLVNATKFQTPEDVSEDYRQHWDSEERLSKKHPTTNEIIFYWSQLKDRNDLRVCECYIAMQVDQAGLIREQKKGEKK